MPVFKDANGKEWKIELDAYNIHSVRQELKFDLSPPNGNPFEALEADPVMVANVAWVLVRDQAPKEGYTDRDFGKALNGDAISLCTEALVAAIVDFSQPQRRGLLRKAMETARQAREAGTELALSKISDPTILEAMKLATAERIDAEIAKALTGLKSVTNTPG